MYIDIFRYNKNYVSRNSKMTYNLERGGGVFWQYQTIHDMFLYGKACHMEFPLYVLFWNLHILCCRGKQESKKLIYIYT